MGEATEVINTESEEQDITEAEGVEAERQDLLARVSSYDLRTLLHKVAWLLNHFPDTRDSDITLQLKYWVTYQQDIYSGGMIDPQDLYKLARLTSVQRARAKIQNEYKLFLASAQVRQRRGTLEEEESERAIEDKPVSSIYAVYMDDSGKHGDYLIVGSVWLLTEFPQIYSTLRSLGQEFGKEFHFADATRADERWYKQLVDALSSRSDALSVKYISVPRRGLRGDDPFTDLYYHLLVEGVDHENWTGRAPLPRRLQSWIDTEESLVDRLRLANLGDRLKQAAASRFHGSLGIDRLDTVNSKTSVLAQVADLIAASVNRAVNPKGSRQNHKDRIATYACSNLGIELGVDPNVQIGDLAVHIAL